MNPELLNYPNRWRLNYVPGWVEAAYDFSGALNIRVKMVSTRFDGRNDLKKYNAFFVGYKLVLIFYNSVFVGYKRIFVGYNSVFVFYNCDFVFYKRVLIYYNPGRIFYDRVFVGYNLVFVFYNPARIFALRVSFEAVKGGVAYPFFVFLKNRIIPTQAFTKSNYLSRDFLIYTHIGVISGRGVDIL